MKVFITGAESFVGKLIKILKKYPKIKVYGCDLNIMKINFSIKQI